MDAVDDCRQAVAGAKRLITSVGPGDLARSTPCKDWNVRALIGHMITMCDAFSIALGATDDAGYVAPPLADLELVDPAPAYGEAAAAALEAWSRPGWADKMLRLPFGTLPGSIGVRIFCGDQLIHTWDLATALGCYFAMPDDLASAQLEMMQRYYDASTRGADQPFDLATDCPPDASVQDRLIALSGRSL